MIKRILLGLSGCDFSSVAIRRAVELASAHQAEITAATVLDVKNIRRVGRVPIGAGAAANELRDFRTQQTLERIEESIAAFETACRKADVACEVQRETGDPYQRILLAARYHDLMIMNLRHMFEYGVKGDAHYNPRKLLVQLLSGGARPLIAHAEKYRPVRRVLVAFSGSAASSKTMKRFAQMRLWPEAKTRVLVCSADEQAAEQLGVDATQYLTSHGFTTESVLRTGDPHQIIAEDAKRWNADMIVLGCGSHTLFRKGSMGKTASHLIRNTSLPLFLGQ